MSENKSNNFEVFDTAFEAVGEKAKGLKKMPKKFLVTLGVINLRRPLYVEYNDNREDGCITLTSRKSRIYCLDENNDDMIATVTELDGEEPHYIDPGYAKELTSEGFKIEQV